MSTPKTERSGREPAATEPAAPPSSLRLLLSDLRIGSLSLEQYLERLQRHFEVREPQVVAFLPEEERFQRLRRQARQLLERYPQPEMRPPLFGLPLGVKDIFHVAGFPTGAGSKLPPEQLQGGEAPVVTALKKAGALVLGKTITTEFAYFAPGPTRNPRNLAHTPGGSSSGSAAAVAADLCPLALGTQTIGSINRPAAFCGVVGYKPTYGRISREGVVPLAASLDHVGFFTSDAFSCAVVASLIVARWQPQQVRRKPVLGVPRGPYLDRASPQGLEHFEGVCEKLSGAGYDVRDVPAMADFAQIEQRHNDLLAAEAAQVHAEWFARYDHLYHARTAALITRGRQVPPSVVAKAREGRERLRQALTALMEDNGIDLWIAPAAPGAAPEGLESTGDPIMNLPWTQSGMPAITIPAGVNESGLPLGLQCVGRWQGDEALLAWAEEIEAEL